MALVRCLPGTRNSNRRVTRPSVAVMMPPSAQVALEGTEEIFKGRVQSWSVDYMIPPRPSPVPERDARLQEP